jgi:phosphonopyruvate decarboxylase
LSNLRREEAIECLKKNLKPDDCLVATTGKTGRELFELRVKHEETPRDFLTVGGMGHGSSIALGIALSTNKRIVCLDGDGALIMHLGAMGIIGSLQVKNFIHVLLNNYCHESVGGQATCSMHLDFARISRACGYTGYYYANTADGIIKAIQSIERGTGPHFLEISLSPGSRPDLGRPTVSPYKNREQFMDYLQKYDLAAL